jgi:hypothetical protein
MLAQTRKLFLLSVFLFIETWVGVPRCHALTTELPSTTDKVSAEETQAGDEAKYSLQGTVVNSVTGEAVRNALVQIYGYRNLSMLTGPDGKFKFEGLPNESTVIQVRKPGFFSEDEIHQSPGGQKQYIVGPDTEPVVIKLFPEGVIYGRISGQDGEGIEGLPIRLMVRRVLEGKISLEQSSAAATDEEGVFRIAELQPGTYFLHVGPGGMPALFPERPSQSGAQGYAAMFYPGTADIDSAAPIQITAGKRAEINLSLTMQSVFRVSGTISGFGEGQFPSLDFADSAGVSIGVNHRFDPTNNHFEAQWLSPGTYTIRAWAQAQTGVNQTLTASVPVTVNSDVSGVRIVLAPSTTIAIRVRADYTKTDSWRPPEGQSFNLAYVMLVSKKGSGPRMNFGAEQVEGGKDGAMQMRNVPPGTYSVVINPSGPLYVQSATSGTLNLLENELTVGAGSSVQPLEIVLRDDVASLDGIVSKDGKPATGLILAIPRQGGGGGIVRTQPTSPDGTFELGQLAPGEYTVMAVDHMDQLEFANEEVMRKYSSKVQEITLASDQKAKTELELIQVQE